MTRFFAGKGTVCDATRITRTCAIEPLALNSSRALCSASHALVVIALLAAESPQYGVAVLDASPSDRFVGAVALTEGAMPCAELQD